jgi:hypothetical protein
MGMAAVDFRWCRDGDDEHHQGWSFTQFALDDVISPTLRGLSATCMTSSGMNLISGTPRMSAHSLLHWYRNYQYPRDIREACGQQNVLEHCQNERTARIEKDTVPTNIESDAVTIAKVVEDLVLAVESVPHKRQISPHERRLDLPANLRASQPSANPRAFAAVPSIVKLAKGRKTGTKGTRGLSIVVANIHTDDVAPYGHELLCAG